MEVGGDRGRQGVLHKRFFKIPEGARGERVSLRREYQRPRTQPNRGLRTLSEQDASSLHGHAAFALPHLPRYAIQEEQDALQDGERRDFICVQSGTQKLVASENLPAELAARFKAGIPLVRFLHKTLNVPF
uniref:Uncharacterized protein n=1 Tax=uncultured marine bacterium Ant4D5 TaxID=360428 RepID=Q2PXY5_9BACT|nr:hypothetical protein [uncultured marine bacterium Ant4D5]